MRISHGAADMPKDVLIRTPPCSNKERKPLRTPPRGNFTDMQSKDKTAALLPRAGYRRRSPPQAARSPHVCGCGLAGDAHVPVQADHPSNIDCLQHFVSVPHVSIETAGPQQRRTRGPRATPTRVHSYFIPQALQNVACLPRWHRCSSNPAEALHGHKAACKRTVLRLHANAR